MNAQTDKKPAPHWQHNTNPARRLEYYKALAGHYCATSGVVPDWRRYRWNKPAALVNGKYSATWSADRKNIFVDSLADCPFKLEGDASDLTCTDYTGWYADSFQDELIKGAVVSFRDPRRMYGTDGDDNGKDTHKKYLAAYYATQSDGATIDFSYYYETKGDAARGADRLAERAAEESREYHAKDQAEQQIERLREEIHELNREALPLLAEIKKAGRHYTPAVCGAVKDKIADILETRRARFHSIAQLTDDFWLAV